MENSRRNAPDEITNIELRFDSFDNGNVLFNKKKGHLPAMGWNSWNAFGSGNTEALTKLMADKFIELSLDKLGYKYLVLDDGCYLNERVDGLLSNNTEKFPSGFKALADYIHDRGLKFGMYNDIGTNLCAGAAVGTCGHEKEDAQSYVNWNVDFLKVDNCYYLWDNATFSDATNAKYTFAPMIHKVDITKGNDVLASFVAGKNMNITGEGAATEEIDGKTYIYHIGTFDGTGPAHSPVGPRYSEIELEFDADTEGRYALSFDCICKMEEGKGSWLQVATDRGASSKLWYDGLYNGEAVDITLKAGHNEIRIMNHRRQENTLNAYAKLLEGLYEADPENEIIYSMCEWGKTQPQNWAKKVGDSWRILNDITFNVGSDGNPGKGSWESDYTTSVTAQYNKAVIMDEFAGLDKGWNDPDMMVIGMDGLSVTQNKTHMAMWCMLNSPLMLGLDLRRIEKGDELYNIIANKALISLNQDPLGIQAKRVYTSLCDSAPDKTYITNNDRVDILAKPLKDGAFALSFINLSGKEKQVNHQISMVDITNTFKERIPKALKEAKGWRVVDLFTEESYFTEDKVSVETLEAYSNVTVKVIPE